MNTNIEIIRNTEECYTPLVDFETWRVAGLNHCDIVDASNLTRVERHLKTDEVFILTAGRAWLVVDRGADGDTFDVIRMEPNRVYNIKRGVYHHVVMDRNASIILVENSDTSIENSEYRDLKAQQIGRLRRSIGAAGA